MVQLRKGRKYIQISCMTELQTEIHVVKGYPEFFVQTAHLVILGPAYHQARACDSRHVLGIAQTSHIAQVHLIVLVMGMARRPVGAETDDNACVLNGIVRIVKLTADCSHIRPLGVHQKLLHPVTGDDLHIIVQEQHILAVGKAYAEIVDFGVVELALVLDNPDLRIVLQGLIVIKDLFCLAVILHNDNLVILIGGLIHDRLHAAGQVLHMILVGNHNGNKRPLQKRITDPENGRERPGALHLDVHAIYVLDMVVYRALGSVHRIGFRVDVLSHACLMGTPVIQGLRYMVYQLCLRGQTKNHVVILASVILAPEYARLVQQVL